MLFSGKQGATHTMILRLITNAQSAELLTLVFGMWNITNILEHPTIVNDGAFLGGMIRIG